MNSDKISNNDFVVIKMSDFDEVIPWIEAANAIADGHLLAKAKLGDVLLEEEGYSWLTRSARIKGLGALTKTASVYPDNPDNALPSIHGAAMLFNDDTGAVDAILDNVIVTRLKTAADSILGARLLAPPNASKLLVLGAGVVAGDLIRAYSKQFNLERISVWNRSKERAKKLQKTLKSEEIEIHIIEDLPSAVADSNLISTATMSKEPLVLANWVSKGTHVDLVGSFSPNMRESDDALISTSQVFVDCRLTTEEKTGDLFYPIQNKSFCADRIKGSLYDLCAGTVGRDGEEAITVFKNGGGGHIDLMVSRFLYQKFMNNKIKSVAD